MWPSLVLIACLAILPSLTISDPKHRNKVAHVPLQRVPARRPGILPVRSGKKHRPGFSPRLPEGFPLGLGPIRITEPKRGGGKVSRIPSIRSGGSGRGHGLTRPRVRGTSLRPSVFPGGNRNVHLGRQKPHITGARGIGLRSGLHGGGVGARFDLSGAPQVIQFGDAGISSGFSIGTLGCITDFIPSGNIIVGEQVTGDVSSTISESWSEIFQQSQTITASSTVSESIASAGSGGCDYCSGPVIETSPYAFGILEVDSVVETGESIKSTIQIENNDCPIDIPRDGSFISKLMLKLKLITILRTNLTNLFRYLLAIPIAKSNNDFYVAVLAIYNALNLRQINLELLLPVLPQIFSAPTQNQLLILVTELVKIVPVDVVTYVQKLVVEIQQPQCVTFLAPEVGIPPIVEGLTQEELTYTAEMTETIKESVSSSSKFGGLGIGSSSSASMSETVSGSIRETVSGGSYGPGPSFTSVDIKDSIYIVEQILRPLVVQINNYPQKELIKSAFYLLLVNLPLDFGVPEAPIRIRDFALKLITLLPDEVWDVIIQQITVTEVVDIYTIVRKCLEVIVSVPSCPALITTYVKVIQQYIPPQCCIQNTVNAFLQPPPPPSVIVLPTQPDLTSISTSVSSIVPLVESRFGFAFSDEKELIVSSAPPTEEDCMNVANVLPVCTNVVVGCDTVQDIRVFLQRPEITAFVTSLNLVPQYFPTKLSLVQYVLRELIQFNLGGTDIVLRFKEYLRVLEQSAFSITIEPWYTGLIRSLYYPGNTRELDYYQVIVEWLSQSNFLTSLGPGFQPSGSLTTGSFLRYLFQFAQNLEFVQQNTQLVSALDFYVNRIFTDGLGALPFDWYEVVNTYEVVEEVDVAPITLDFNSIFEVINRESISVSLERSLYDFFSCEFQPKVHAIGFNYLQYQTKGEWFKALVEYLCEQKTVSTKWKSVLQSVSPLIRLSGPGSEPLSILNF
ncbi:uncharacterized protein [Periplaneta americana]|uniref:uncharacterized protein n=1 Tax=Periplaneta americana TaxID=6978 RepID=UPI0037E858A2